MKQQTATKQKLHKQPMNSYAKVSLTAAIIFIIGLIVTLSASLIAKAICIDNSIAATEGSIFLSVASSSEYFTSDDIFQKTPSIPESAKITTAIQEHGGEIAGIITRYQFRTPVQVINQNTIEDFLAADLSTLSKSEIPIAVPTDSSKYYFELDYLKELAPDLSFVAVANIPNLDGIYLVEDNTDKIASFLTSSLSSSIHAFNSNDVDASENTGHSTNHPATYSLVAKFPNLASLQSYLNSTSQDITTMTSPIGSTLDIISDFSFFYRIFWIVAGTLSFILLCACLVFVHKGTNS